MAQPRDSISGELRRRSIAASTIREALGQYMVEERDRIVAKLANTQVSLPDLLAVQADAKAYIKLRNELERAISQGSTDSE